MAWYDIDIYVGRPSSVWDTALGTLAPGSLHGLGTMTTARTPSAERTRHAHRRSLSASC